jgi:hypothetical protein
MRQAPIAFSRGAFLTALFIVVGLVVAGIGGTWLTIRQTGGSLAAIAAAQRTTAARGPAPREIEGVSQTLIEVDDNTAVTRRDEMRRLSSYGWVDRARGVVHIPIDRAMRLVAGAPR